MLSLTAVLLLQAAATTWPDVAMAAIGAIVLLGYFYFAFKD